jgi:deoxyguanosine kinase
MKHHFITVEGNIGVGKTTLTHLLAKHFNARLILEEFADNPFLPKFYETRPICFSAGTVFYGRAV